MEFPYEKYAKSAVPTRNTYYGFMDEQKQNIQKKKIPLQIISDPIVANIPNNFFIGSRVFHQKFGYGIIEEINVDKVRVIFEKSEPKDIMASFLVHEDDV